MHSHEGVADEGAVERLEKRRRQQKGENGGVIKYIFSASIMAPEGNMSWAYFHSIRLI